MNILSLDPLYSRTKSSRKPKKVKLKNITYEPIKPKMQVDAPTLGVLTIKLENKIPPNLIQ